MKNRTPGRIRSLMRQRSLAILAGVTLVALIAAFVTSHRFDGGALTRRGEPFLPALKTSLDTVDPARYPDLGLADGTHIEVKTLSIDANSGAGKAPASPGS